MDGPARLRSRRPVNTTPAITEETLFVLVDDALIRLGVTSGATIDEARDAIRHLEATGVLRAIEDGLVITQPPNVTT